MEQDKLFVDYQNLQKIGAAFHDILAGSLEEAISIVTYIPVRGNIIELPLAHTIEPKHVKALVGDNHESFCTVFKDQTVELTGREAQLFIVGGNEPDAEINETFVKMSAAFEHYPNIFRGDIFIVYPMKEIFPCVS